MVWKNLNENFEGYTVCRYTDVRERDCRRELNVPDSPKTEETVLLGMRFNLYTEPSVNRLLVISHVKFTPSQVCFTVKDTRGWDNLWLMLEDVADIQILVDDNV